MASMATGCNKKEKIRTDLKDEVKTQHAALVYANYQDALSAAKTLHDRLDDFLANPSDATMDAAKTAWLAAREPYGLTEAYRFASGPIDDADGPEGLLNAWPLDEGYVDYVVGNATSGIVNDPSVSIDASTLESLNEVGAEENIAIGFHAIEFLLWGQDNANTSLQTPGQRPYTDFVTGGTADNQDRRGEYLAVCADLLLTHLQQMVDEWNPTRGGNYYTEFMALDNDEALRRILTGIGILSKSELAGERVFTALDNQDQEDEHSCFSDNTHRDIITNTIGIRNVYLGAYTRTNGTQVYGTGIYELAEQYDSEVNEQVVSLLNDAVNKVEAIPVPFDYALTQESVGGNGPIQAAVNALQQLGDKIAEMAGKMDISISTDLPD
jgi:putative iron-regulated protein